MRSGVTWSSLLLLLTLAQLTASGAAQFEDARCKCICPKMNSSDSSNQQRRIWIATKSAHECKCENVVDLKHGGANKVQCARCDCKYETRNTTTIKVLVGLVITIITCLLLYMVFLVILRPLVTKQGFISHEFRAGGGGAKFSRSVLVEELDDDGDTACGRPRDTTTELSMAADLPAAELQLAGVMAGRTRSRSDPVTEVVQRARHQQERWDRAVKEQRYRVYKNHQMLN